eukprot:m.46037 g.46037  ORF g.46037 m.46037 type:complete len:795 (+) comp11824_c0_seq2:240-2624(+)
MMSEHQAQEAELLNMFPQIEPADASRALAMTSGNVAEAVDLLLAQDFAAPSSESDGKAAFVPAVVTTEEAEEEQKQQRLRRKTIEEELSDTRLNLAATTRAGLDDEDIFEEVSRILSTYSELPDEELFRLAALENDERLIDIEAEADGGWQEKKAGDGDAADSGDVPKSSAETQLSQHIMDSRVTALRRMFVDLDEDMLEEALRICQYQVEDAVDLLLAMGVPDSEDNAGSQELSPPLSPDPTPPSKPSGVSPVVSDGKSSLHPTPQASSLRSPRTHNQSAVSTPLSATSSLLSGSSTPTLSPSAASASPTASSVTGSAGTGTNPFPTPRQSPCKGSGAKAPQPAAGVATASANATGHRRTTSQGGSPPKWLASDNHGQSSLSALFGTNPLSAAQGQLSWKQREDVIAAGVLNTMDRMSIQRQEAIAELAASEQSYVEDVKVLTKVVLDRLNEHARTALRAGQQPVIPATDIARMHRDTSQLRKVAEAFLEDLRRRQSAGPVVSRISDVVLLHVWELHKAFYRYCEVAFELRVHLGNKRVLAALGKIDETLTRRLPLSAFAIAPIQRLARYPLLLQVIEKLSPRDHPDLAGVQEACQRMVYTAEMCDSRMRELDDFKHLSELETQMDFSRLQDPIPLAIQQPCRSLVKRGALTLLTVQSDSHIKSKLVEVLLLSDMFVYAKPVKIKGTDERKFIVYKQVRDAFFRLNRHQCSQHTHTHAVQPTQPVDLHKCKRLLSHVHVSGSQSTCGGRGRGARPQQRLRKRHQNSSVWYRRVPVVVFCCEFEYVPERVDEGA